MEFSELRCSIEAYIEAEVEKRIKDYPVYIHLDGYIIDQDDIEYNHGQIDVTLSSPIYMHKTGVA